MPLIPGVVAKHLRQFNGDQIDAAKETIAALARTSPDPKVRMTAAQYILDMETAPRVVSIEASIKGLTIEEAVDTIIAAAAGGQCALEDADRLIAMIHKKSEIVELGKLKAKLEELNEPRQLK